MPSDKSLDELKAQQAQELTTHTKNQLWNYRNFLKFLLVLGIFAALTAVTGGLGLLIPVCIAGAAFLPQGAAIGLLVGGVISAVATFFVRKREMAKCFLHQRSNLNQDLQNTINQKEKSGISSAHHTFSQTTLDKVKEAYDDPSHLNHAKHLTLQHVNKVIQLFEQEEQAFYTKEWLEQEAKRMTALS